MGVLDATPIGYTDTSPPTREIGAETQQTGGVNGWASFIDEMEFVPELAWPSSIQTYHRMRSDSQVESLHIGTVQPIREFRWSIDPNKAKASIVEKVAGDMGLPIRGQEDDAIGRSSNAFDFDSFLSDALLAPLYGHFHFEIVGDQTGSEWHLTKLAPRHPRTIMEFQTQTTGELMGIRQNIAGAAGRNRMPEPIPAYKLVPLVWRPEAGSHVGRSLMRSLYREWLVKDRVIRVAAINIERAGGMPVIKGPQGASDEQIRDLAQLARTFKVAEGGGGAIPFGSDLVLVGGHTPDAINLLKYCDECMARVWALMLVQLGMTQTGNRALGAEFAIYAARAQRAMAKWVAAAVNRFLDQYTEWNGGPGETHAPLLHYENPKPDSMSVADLVSLIDAGALHVDPELETWLRAEHGLPEMAELPQNPDLGTLTPEEVALVQNARNPPQLPPGTAKPPSALQEPLVEPTLAAGGEPGSPLAQPLPDRPLRRGLTDFEVRAGTNFRALDQAHASILAQAEALYRGHVIPAQIAALSGQVSAMSAPTRDDLASIAAPPEGQDQLHPLLTAAARSGAAAAISELTAQGLPAITAPADADLATKVADQADAFTTMAAHGLSLAAQRKATSLVAEGRSADALATEMATHLAGMKHQWTVDQLGGAITFAQNVGRAAVFGDYESAGETLSYEASELLDTNTCDPCRANDGKRYDSLAAGIRDYAAGGYIGCLGGPRCRGTLVAVGNEQNPVSTSDAFTRSLSVA